MKKQYPKLKTVTAVHTWPRWLHMILRGLRILLLLQLLIGIGVVWYVKSHKKEILLSVTEKLNENLNGSLTISDMEPTFFKNFPRISLHLKNVALRDTMYESHRKTLLQANDIDIALNAFAFVKGMVEIHKISISNASINLFTDANGYSNSAIFKKNVKKEKDSVLYPELKKFELENVNVSIDNQNKHKLFQFDVRKINGKMNASTKGWSVDFSMETLVKSLAFSTRRGSFIKDKMVEGDFEVVYDSDKKSINVQPNALDIGGEDFTISAEFKTTADETTDYAFHIVNDKILWYNAAHLLTQNIYSRLDLFKIKDPIAVRCDISGNFDVEGDPFILVKAKIEDNEITTPGGLISNCSFNGIFTNNQEQSKGFNDANSAILFENFKGLYAGLPVTMKYAAILNLEKPMAKGDFQSAFKLQQLSNIIDSRLLQFTNGTALVNLTFNADIINYMIAKPIVKGTVEVKDGDIEYAPRNLHFKKTSVLLEFKNNDLLINNIHLQSGQSVINMQGQVRNFLNLYYTAPEKVLIDWKINSPEIHLSEFLKFLGKRTIAKKSAKPKKNADFTDDINEFFDQSSVNVALRVKKLFYNKFLATDVRADLSLAGANVFVKNGGLSNSNGTVLFNAALSQQGQINNYKINASVKNVEVSQFFDAFDNFGLESMGSKNINGKLFADTNLTGKITDNGTLVPNAMVGLVNFRLEKAALLNFDPIRNIGKYAFPLRDMNNISIEALQGKLSIVGEKVTISPMQVNSSILNMDIEGLYSFGKGTSINVSVPLRNPEKDKDITDADALAKRRERGVVVRLLAADDESGKVKIKLVSKKTQLEEQRMRNN